MPSRRAASRRGWLGVTLTPSIAARHGSAARELTIMARSGVESVRVAVYWTQLQPRRDRRPDLAPLDALVGAAAARGVAVMPVVLGAPRWADRAGWRPIPVPRATRACCVRRTTP